jgi:hypothetical protein
MNERKNQALSGIPYCSSALKKKKKEGKATVSHMQTISPI